MPKLDYLNTLIQRHSTYFHNIGPPSGIFTILQSYKSSVQRDDTPSITFSVHIDINTFESLTHKIRHNGLASVVFGMIPRRNQLELLALALMAWDGIIPKSQELSKGMDELM